MSTFTPVNQVRLTNVATVKLHKKGKRFEIACYRNKVLSWRNKLETDIREVLQIDNIFTNVSKGTLASKKDLNEVFGSTDHVVVCQEILDKGELQVSEQERGALYETVFRDIASIVTDKTVNPENNRPYTINIIQKAMRQIQFSVNVTKSSKSQALEVIRKLREIMPIVRASMLIRIVCKKKDTLSLLPEVEKLNGLVLQRTTHSHSSSASSASAAAGEDENDMEEYVDIRIDPEQYRKVEEIVQELTKESGRVEVLQLRMANTITAITAATATAPITTSSSAATSSPIPTTSTPTIPVKEADIDASSDVDAAEDNDNLSDVSHDEVEEGNEKEVEEDGEEEGEMMMPNPHQVTKAQLKKLKKQTRRNNNSNLQHLDEEDSLLTSSTVNATSTTATASNVNTNATMKVKQSKKDKRAEKEWIKEQETQAKALQARILAKQKQQLQQQQQQQQEVINITVESDATAAVATSSADTTTTATVAPVATPAVVAGKVQSCNTCGGAFPDSAAYREHFRSEWHRFNLKRKMKNLTVIPSEEAFLALTIADLKI